MTQSVFCKDNSSEGEHASSPKEEVVVELLNVTKKYGHVSVVDDVTLQIKQGEVLGLLGPNGAGKSTLIRLLLNLVHPTSGQVVIFGHDVKKTDRRIIDGVGAWIETPQMYPFLTGRQALKQLARMHQNVSSADVNSVIESMGLAAYIDHQIALYSFGMLQRLGLAQALMHKPKLLVLDEPANGLDPDGIRQFQATIMKLAASKVSVLLSSHMLTEVQELCSRIIVMKQGRIVACESIQSLRTSSTSTILLTVGNPVLASEIAQTRGWTVISQMPSQLRVLANRDPADLVALLTGRDISVSEVIHESVSLKDRFSSYINQ